MTLNKDLKFCFTVPPQKFSIFKVPQHSNRISHGLASFRGRFDEQINPFSGSRLVRVVASHFVKSNPILLPALPIPP